MWNCYRDKVNDSANENNDANNCRINNNKMATSKSFEYRTKLKGSTPNDNSKLKYSSNFWGSLDLPLINCEIELDLT